MAQDEQAASSDKAKGKEPANATNGTKEPEKDKDGKIIKTDLPPGTQSHHCCCPSAHLTDRMCIRGVERRGPEAER